MNEVTDLKFLIRAKYGSIRKFSEVIGLSENTIQTHIKDGNWDMRQAIKIVKALNMPPKFVYVYFFEPMLSKYESSEAT